MAFENSGTKMRLSKWRMVGDITLARQIALWPELGRLRCFDS